MKPKKPSDMELKVSRPAGNGFQVLVFVGTILVNVRVFDKTPEVLLDV